MWTHTLSDVTEAIWSHSMNVRSRQRSTLAAAALVATAITVLAGCAASNSPSPSGSADGGFTEEQIATGVEYTGGTAEAADSSLEPVKIGFINVDGGVPSFPESTDAAQVAAQFVNEHLGGIDGHPVEVVQCSIVQGDEDGQKCAQQFANDESILSIQLGMTIFGTGPIYSTIGQSKVITGQGTFTPIDLDNPGVSVYEGAAYSTGPSVVLYADQFLDAKSIAVVYPGEDAGALGAVQTITNVAKEYDIDVTSVPVSDDSQWSAALLSAGAQSADAIVMSGSTPKCVPFGQAVDQLALTAPVMVFGFCQDASVAEAFGDYPKWTYINPLKSPIGVDQPDVELYGAVMAAYSPETNVGGGASGTFQMIISQVRAMNAIGYDNLTVDTIRDEIANFSGPLFLGPPTIECGQFADLGAQSLCNTTGFPITYEGDDVWTDPTDGEGLDVGGLALETR